MNELLKIIEEVENRRKAKHVIVTGGEVGDSLHASLLTDGNNLFNPHAMCGRIDWVYDITAQEMIYGSLK